MMPIEFKEASFEEAVLCHAAGARPWPSGGYARLIGETAHFELILHLYAFSCSEYPARIADCAKALPAWDQLPMV